MIVETLTFRLAPGIDEADFVAADKQAQTDVAYQQPGLLRRTTARGDDGEWLVVTLWDAEPAAEPGAADIEHAPLADLVDRSTVVRNRYHTLD